MAVIKATTQILPYNADECFMIVWPSLSYPDTGEPVELAQYAFRSVQVSGSFGVLGTVRIQGSNDQTNWSDLTDMQGADLVFQGAKIKTIADLTRYIRPAVTGGTGSIAIKVSLLMRRSAA